jgi:hypothetical protein
LVDQWIEVALEAQQSPFIFKYEISDKQLKPVKPWTPLWMCYLLLSELKSFEGDIILVGDIASNQGAHRDKRDQYLGDRVMKLCHCIDQHAMTDIGWYLRSEESYRELFQKIWRHSVGVNPRTAPTESLWNSPFHSQVKLFFV